MLFLACKQYSEGRGICQAFLIIPNTLNYGRQPVTHLKELQVESLTYSKLVFEQLDLESVQLGVLEMRRSKVARLRSRSCTIREMVVRKTSMESCIFQDLKCSELVLEDVEIGVMTFDRCEIGTVVLRGSKVKLMTVSGGKLESIRLRESTVEVTINGARCGVYEATAGSIMKINLGGVVVRRLEFAGSNVQINADDSNLGGLFVNGGRLSKSSIRESTLTVDS